MESIIGLEFTYQNNFVFALSDKGKIFMWTITGYSFSDQHICFEFQSLCFGLIGDKICLSDKEQPVQAKVS